MFVGIPIFTLIYFIRLIFYFHCDSSTSMHNFHSFFTAVLCILFFVAWKYSNFSRLGTEYWLQIIKLGGKTLGVNTGWNKSSLGNRRPVNKAGYICSVARYRVVRLCRFCSGTVYELQHSSSRASGQPTTEHNTVHVDSALRVKTCYRRVTS